MLCTRYLIVASQLGLKKDAFSSFMGRALTQTKIFWIQIASLYARYLCSRDALGLKAGQARRATIGYLVYKLLPEN